MADDPALNEYYKLIGSQVPTQPDPAAQAKANAQARASQQIGDLQAQYNYRLPELQHQGELTRRGISFGFEDRGLGASGMKGEALDEQRRRQRYEEGLMQLNLSQQIAGINLGLSQALAAAAAAGSYSNVGGLYGSYAPQVGLPTGGGVNGYRS